MPLKSTQRLYTSLRSEIERYYGEMYMRLVLILTQVSISQRKIDGLIKHILKIISSTESEPAAVAAIARAIGDFKIPQRQLSERAIYFNNLVVGHVIAGGTLLDFGCGDGEVSCGMMGVGHSTDDLLLYDVIDYRTDQCKSYGHGFTTDWDEVERRAPFDCSLVMMVLHHTEDPELELDRLATVSRRLIVVESVVSRLNPPPVQGLIDWFYNRCLHPGAEIPVPGNFSLDEIWLKRFYTRGFKLVHRQNLGVDILICPENHVLYVLHKED